MTNPLDKARPCPFCGSKDTFYIFGLAVRRQAVACRDCAAHGPITNRSVLVLHLRGEAIRLWNGFSAVKAWNGEKDE